MLAALTLWLAAAVTPASLAGNYDGSRMEMAVGLELGADGRFRYGLSYGALDEEGEGRWTLENGQVLLTSDPPVTPPRILFVNQQPGQAGELSITLDVPRGVSAQYFDAAILNKNGDGDLHQLRDEGLTIPVTPDDPPEKVQVVLTMFQIAGDPVTIDPAKGYSLRFRFEPNDIGKADFKATPLAIEGDDLLLQRHDRLIRFRRAGSAEAPHE